MADTISYKLVYHTGGNKPCVKLEVNNSFIFMQCKELFWYDHEEPTKEQYMCYHFLVLYIGYPVSANQALPLIGVTK